MTNLNHAEFHGLREFFSTPCGLLRGTGRARNAMTIAKSRERICGYLGWLKQSGRKKHPSFEHFRDLDLFLVSRSFPFGSGCAVVMLARLAPMICFSSSYSLNFSSSHGQDKYVDGYLVGIRGLAHGSIANAITAAIDVHKYLEYQEPELSNTNGGKSLNIARLKNRRNKEQTLAERQRQASVEEEGTAILWEQVGWLLGYRGPRCDSLV